LLKLVKTQDPACRLPLQKTILFHQSICESVGLSAKTNASIPRKSNRVRSLGKTGRLVWCLCMPSENDALAHAVLSWVWLVWLALM
jgi:hypothetical protein